MRNSSPTIAACATPPGTSALAVIRLSGGQAFEIADRIFKPLKKNIRPSEFNTHTCHVGNIVKDSKPVDQAVLSVMRGPSSYTGEDMIEISCHGSMLIVSQILRLCFSSGASPAGPGEFTKRAFFNGKMDLSQAEAVNSLIRARTENSKQQALALVNGKLKEKLEKIREALEHLKMLLDADIEWGEIESIDFFNGRGLKQRLEDIIEQADEIAENVSSREQALGGYKVVICGKPNAGKSSLFNTFLNMSRSIVSKMPGTTRDVIKAETVIEGVLLCFVDTAGIGLENKNEVDEIAACRSIAEIKDSDIVLYVMDASGRLNEIDYSIRRKIGEKKFLAVLNKIDLNCNISTDELEEFCGESRLIRLCCKNKEGVDVLLKQIKKEVTQGQSHKLMISIRQRKAALKLKENLSRALKESRESAGSEIVSFLISRALDFLGEIDGKNIKGNMLDRIFKNFCIGK